MTSKIQTNDKKVKDMLHRTERINKTILKEQRKAMNYLEQEGGGYLLAENENEKTLKVSQDMLASMMPKYNKDNVFDLALNYGSYSIDYTSNGSYLLLCGEKGHISVLDWRNKDLLCEVKVQEKIRSGKFLHNETMFAVAQKKRTYIYDRQGIELHSLDHMSEPKFIEFLRYHFLLVCGLKRNMLKYQDISIGKIISEIKTKSGEMTSMCQNPYNAVIFTGHSNGVVNLFTPNFSESVVKILTHPNSVNSISVDTTGHYLVTTGNDSKMRVWDLRNSYKQLYEYFNPMIATSCEISQRGLLAVSYSNVVEVWKDYYREKQKEPYMKHHFKNNQTKSKSLKFCNFEDFLGVGTNFGFSSVVVPGSGEPNFDTFENNPFQTKKQRQSSEVKSVLEKIPANMISLDPNQVNRVDTRSKQVIDKERKEEIKQKTEDIMKEQKKKLKMRLKNKESKSIRNI
jgi:U3 small nucleolar RNA-associated protein 7